MCKNNNTNFENNLFTLQIVQICSSVLIKTKYYLNFNLLFYNWDPKTEHKGLKQKHWVMQLKYNNIMYCSDMCEWMTGTSSPSNAATQDSDASQMAVRSWPPSSAKTTRPPANFINCLVRWPKPMQKARSMLSNSWSINKLKSLQQTLTPPILTEM